MTLSPRGMGWVDGVPEAAAGEQVDSCDWPPSVNIAHMIAKIRSGQPLTVDRGGAAAADASPSDGQLRGTNKTPT